MPAAESAAAPPAEDVDHTGSFYLFNAAPSWLISMVIHAVFFLIAPFILISSGNADKLTQIVMGEVPDEDTVEVEEFILEETPTLEIKDVDVNETVASFASPVDTTIEDVFEGVQLEASVDPAPVSIELVTFAEKTAPKSDLLKDIGGVGGTGVSGRAAGQRGQMIARYGGNKESEDAVKAALKWLAAHQRPDGSWCFDHRFENSCRGQCGNHGSLDKDLNAATAMALLPFLGAGQTHMEGVYKDNVRAGLMYLTNHQKSDGALNSGGSMYSHGLASIALCEAYAMTQDRGLMGPAQASINFIAYAQDRVGGGWRYKPHEPGDTSVVGWQLMALKSGHMGYLAVRPETIKGTTRFLDYVQTDSGAFYGYKDPGRGQATTAVGLLCRMYTGWDRQHPALDRGVQYLAKTGPSKTNMYYNYYATQVMRHYEGEEWETWNTPMRDWLVAEQERKGHEAGSWYIQGDNHGQRAGRLYSTSMATMILEVYYRHLPIYAKAASSDDFPL
jgi:hypothetical protein